MVKDLKNSFAGKKIFVTGHTGFKGVWLMEFLEYLGAETFGYSLMANSQPNHYSMIGKKYRETIGDICDLEKLTTAISSFDPDAIIHLAAQSLVRKSYQDPIETYQSNVMGSLMILKASHAAKNLRSILMITTDKVYENLEIEHSYHENDRLGGYDMYSSSKACCEILVGSYRRSFYPILDFGNKHQVLIATARAGNVIGGGDWNQDRLIPDLILSAVTERSVSIRNPLAIRPWQHVLDCIQGYILLTRKMLESDTSISGAWNFSPAKEGNLNVIEIAEHCKSVWPKIQYHIEKQQGAPHEAGILMLDSSKAVSLLGWQAKYQAEEAVKQTVEWYKNYYQQNTVITAKQIEEYLNQNAV